MAVRLVDRCTEGMVRIMPQCIQLINESFEAKRITRRITTLQFFSEFRESPDSGLQSLIEEILFSVYF